MWYPTGWSIVSSEGLSLSLGPVALSVGVSGGSFFLEHECGYHLRLVFIAREATYGISPPLAFGFSFRSMASMPLGQIYGFDRRALCGRDFEGDFNIHVGGEASLFVGANACLISFGRWANGRCVAVGSFLSSSIGVQLGASATLCGSGRVTHVISGAGHLPPEYAAAAYDRR